MLVMGTMEWASTIESGEFTCPTCGGSKSYQRKVARPFFTLYFIPIFPIGGLKEFVICRGCRGRFEPAVLMVARTANMNGTTSSVPSGSFDEELLRLIALMIVEDDTITEIEIHMAQRIYQGMIGRELARSTLERACREVISLRINAARYVGIAGTGMTYDQKLMAVQAMFAVAGAEGQISPRRMRSLLESQQQLGLDDVSFQTAVKEASAWVA